MHINTGQGSSVGGWNSEWHKFGEDNGIQRLTAICLNKQLIRYFSCASFPAQEGCELDEEDAEGEGAAGSSDAAAAGITQAQELIQLEWSKVGGLVEGWGLKVGFRDWV